MAAKPSESAARIIGSRELHQNLPAILLELENRVVRYVLTVHGKPKAVLIGIDSYFDLLSNPKGSSEAMVGLQLNAMLDLGLGSDELEQLARVLDCEQQ